jgi:hypothetical protein
MHPPCSAVECRDRFQLEREAAFQSKLPIFAKNLAMGLHLSGWVGSGAGTAMVSKIDQKIGYCADLALSAKPDPEIPVLTRGQ